MSIDKASDLASLSRESSADAGAGGALRVPIASRRWKTRVLLPALVLLVTAALFGFSARDVLLPVVEVTVVPVVARPNHDAQPENTVIVQAPGWVEADPFPVAVSALADGVVDEVLVLEGDRVEPGQVVARLVDDDAKIALSQAEARLNSERALLASAKAMLGEAEQNWEHPIELKRTHDAAEAALAERRAELARWPAELARAEATAVTLKAELDKLTPLHESGRATELEFVRARQAYEVQQAEVDLVRLRRPILEAQIASMRAEVDAAHHRLELRIPDTRALHDARAMVHQAEAAVALAEALRDRAALTLARMEVRATTGGVVMSRLAEPGSKLMLNMDNPRSAQAVRLYDPEKLQVRVDVPLSESAKLGVGQPAEIVVDVLPDRVFKGHISRVLHEADVQKNTLQVKVAIENPSEDLRPEMLARARFLAMPKQPDAAAKPSDALFAPRHAVFDGAEGAYVWRADQVTGRAERVAVVTGGRLAEQDAIALREGVRLGDRLIVDPPGDLHDGARIRIATERKEAR